MINACVEWGHDGRFFGCVKHEFRLRMWVTWLLKRKFKTDGEEGASEERENGGIRERELKRMIGGKMLPEEVSWQELLKSALIWC